MDVPDDSDISDFEGEDGDDASEYVWAWLGLWWFRQFGKGYWAGR